MPNQSAPTGRDELRLLSVILHAIRQGKADASAGEDRECAESILSEIDCPPQPHAAG